MHQSIQELGLEITAYVYELQDLTNVIKDMDQVLMKEETPENRMMMGEVIIRYKANMERLKILLECFFFEEKKHNLPRDLSFQRLYKNLLKAI